MSRKSKSINSGNLDSNLSYITGGCVIRCVNYVKRGENKYAIECDGKVCYFDWKQKKAFMELCRKVLNRY